MLGALVNLIGYVDNGANEAAYFGRRGGDLGGLLMLDVIFLGFVLVGARLFLACIGFSLPLPGLLSTVMVSLILLWTLWFGLRVGHQRGVGLYMLFVIGLFFLGLLEFGMEKWGVVAATHISCYDFELWPYFC